MKSSRQIYCDLVCFKNLLIKFFIIIITIIIIIIIIIIIYLTTCHLGAESSFKRERETNYKY